jgi:hypothetical protein
MEMKSQPHTIQNFQSTGAAFRRNIAYLIVTE